MASASDAEFIDALCRKRFDAFAERAFAAIEPSIAYEWNWHLGCISEHLQAVERGEIPRLIINMPPRTLKSYLVATAFPAWILGRTPHTKFICTSYGYEVVEANARKCKQILNSEWYRQLFPGMQLSPLLDRITHFETTEGGQYYAASALSPLTGLGCFIGTTKVFTSSGNKAISKIKVGNKVWSYSHERRKYELRTVSAVRAHRMPGLVQVKTASGRTILCTPDHLFWVDGKGYEQAESLKTGDKFISARLYENTENGLHITMRLLRQGIYSIKGRLSEMQAKGICRVLLFKHLLTKTPQFQEQKTLHNMQAENKFSVKKILRSLQGKIFQKRTESIQQAVSFDKTTNGLSRWISMLHMRGQKEKAPSPHRRRQSQSRPGEPNNYLPTLPCQAPPGEWQDYCAEIIKYSEEEHTVYDIRVEENHNFFAEGILVHNCDYMLCDDLIRPMEAYSDTVRNSTNANIRATLLTRFNDRRTGKFIMVMQRLHDDDPTGFLMRDGGYHMLVLPAETKSKIMIDLGTNKWEMQENSLLFPARLSRETLDRIRLDMSEYNYAGQFLQSPVPVGGGEFKEGWVQHYAAGSIKPKEMNIAILVDQAGGEELNKKKRKLSDWTVIMVIGLAPDNNYYLLDMVRDRFNPTERIETIFMMHRKWNALTKKPPKVGCEQIGLMTDTHYLNEKKKQDAYHFPVIPLGAGQRISKEERIRKLIPIMQNGRFYVPDSLIYVDYEGRRWDLVREFIDVELATFPKSRYDDMCLVAGTFISTNKGNIAIEQIKLGDKVLTPDGFKEVVACGLTGARQVISNRGLTGTPNHPVFTIDRSYIPLDSVTRVNDTIGLDICSWIRIALLKSLSSVESNSVGWEEAVTIISRNPQQMQDARILKACMLQFGNFIRVRKYQMAMRLIIKIATHLITSLIILSAYRSLFIKAFLKTSIGRKWQKTLNVLDRWLQLGIDQMPGGNGIDSMARKSWPDYLSKIPTPVLNVGAYLPQEPLKENQLSSARIYAEKDSGVRLTHERTNILSSAAYVIKNIWHKHQKPNVVQEDALILSAGEKYVYNLSVEDVHCYFANNVLVHNCDTASRILDSELSMTFPALKIGTVAKARREANAPVQNWENY